MDIYVYDEDLIECAVIDTYTSFVPSKTYNLGGSFEIKCPVRENLYAINALKNGHYVRIDGEEIGYINSVNIIRDEANVPTISCRGYLMSSGIEQRTIWVESSKNLKTILLENLIESVDEDRRVDNLLLSSDFPDNITYEHSLKGENLMSAVNALALQYGFGFEVLFDEVNKKMFFSIYYGSDRSIEQIDNEQIVFCEEYENLSTSSYLQSYAGCVNSVYVKCKLPEGIEPPTQIPSYSISEGAGVNRFETCIEVEAVTTDVQEITQIGESSITTTKTYLQDQETYYKMKSEAQKQLVAMQENFTGMIQVSKSGYGVKFFIGDVVTIVETKWDQMINQRVTGVTKYYESANGNQVHTECTFGDPARTIIDILKKR